MATDFEYDELEEQATRTAPLRQVSSNKQKRRRLTPEQHGMLEVYFLKSPMPDTKAREALALQTGL